MKKGMRFKHARVLSSMEFDGKTSQVYQVTAVRKGYVYYRPVYNYGTRESLGSPECCTIEQFPRIAQPERSVSDAV